MCGVGANIEHGETSKAIKPAPSQC